MKRWFSKALAAVLGIGVAIAANQILNNGVLRWGWVPVAVALALAGVVVERLFHTSPGEGRRGRGSDQAGQVRSDDVESPASWKIGQGDHEFNVEFQVAYEAAGGATVLGNAQAPMTPIGPGHFQPLAGRDESDQAVLCGLPGQPAAVVPQAAWAALVDVGGRADEGGGVVAVGFPASSSETELLVVDGSTATVIELAGGEWKPGRLRRAGVGSSWWWEPLPAVGFDLAHNTRWAGFETFDLRLRAVAAFPWPQSAVESEVSAERRRRLQRAMAVTEFAKACTVLSMRRGGLLAESLWVTATGNDTFGSGRCIHLRAALATPDGRPALIGDVLVQLPDYLLLSSILTCVQLRIDFRAWRSVLEVGGARVDDDSDLRLSLLEVVEVLASAWNTAVGPAALAVVDEPRTMPLTQAPFVELHLDAKPPPSRQPNLGLAGGVDLSALGSPTRDNWCTNTGMWVHGPLDLDRPSRRDLIGSGLASLGRSWSYVDARAEDLLS